MTKIQIAIDGPASAGKSTVAKLVAAKLAYVYCDTGAMYRATTWLALEEGVDLSDNDALGKLAQTMDLRFEPGDPQRVFVGQTEVTKAIRLPRIANKVSQVAAQPKVREALVAKQQEIAAAGGIVMDGRDIGTTVLPGAEVKIFLVASVHERALRRYKENQAKNIPCELAELEQEIADRDHKDMTRKVSPLTQAKDAVKVDTTSMGIDEVVAAIMKIVADKTGITA